MRRFPRAFALAAGLTIPAFGFAEETAETTAATPPATAVPAEAKSDQSVGKPMEAEPKGEKPVAAKSAEIEVVFVLDTTGSMSGLIQAAKDKVWAIANTLATAEPAPTIRFGLIGYRDKGDAYVTRHFQLSDDLDAAYTDLFDYAAQGGGDTPEAVNRALNEAVTQIEWSSDPNVFRVIYLVGDCPPHDNEEGEVPYQESCKLALERDIIINTIQCGSHAATTPIWQEIAKAAKGDFSQIAQSGGLVVMETPFDKQIAELSAQRDATRVWFGCAEELGRQVQIIDGKERILAESTPAQQARRGYFNSLSNGAMNFYSCPTPLAGNEAGRVRELVVTLSDDEFDHDNEEMVKMLPAEWQELTKEQRVERAKKIMAERDKLAKEIADLNEKRQAHIKEELKKAGEDAPALDKALFDSISEQAESKGFGGFGGGAPSF